MVFLHGAYDPELIVFSCFIDHFKTSAQLFEHRPGKTKDCLRYAKGSILRGECGLWCF